MQDLNDFYLFAQVVEHGGFAAASRAVNVPKSRLSRRIAGLEERLGVRLLQRSTRAFSVTDIGQTFYRHCLAMLVEAAAAEEAIARSRAEPQGLIRVSAPPALVCFKVGPMVARFMVANPRVTVQLESTSRRVDVVGEGVDVALRVRFPPFETSDLIVRPLGASTHCLVASPALARQLPERPTPADVSRLPTLDLAVASGQHVWRLDDPTGASEDVQHQPRLVTDDIAQLRHAALAGVGIANLPTMVAAADLSSGSLVDVLPRWRPRGGSVQAVFASRRGLLPAVRAFIDALVTEFAAPEAAAGRIGH